MVKNKIARISLMGGWIIGLMFTNPRKALNDCVKQHNKKGWRATFIVPHSERNLLVIILQIILLACTLGFWTFGAGYLIMFEKED